MISRNSFAIQPTRQYFKYNDSEHRNSIRNLVLINITRLINITVWNISEHSNQYPLPITPNCCGDSVFSWTVPGNEPDASDKRSDNATADPPGEIDLVDIFDPANETISA